MYHNSEIKALQDVAGQFAGRYKPVDTLLTAFAYLTIFALLAALAWRDLLEYILPNEMNAALALSCLALHIAGDWQWMSPIDALIGAVVAEFVSSTRGLGYMINASAVTLEVNIMFAALLSLALIGIAASQLLRALHHLLVFWDRSGAGTVVASE